MLLKFFWQGLQMFYNLKKKTTQCLMEQKLIKCNNALKLKTQK